MIEEISTSNKKPINLPPLIMLLSFCMSKDIYEDCKRHDYDKEENNRRYLMIRDKGEVR